MTKEEKKILRNNVIKFVIWWILLAFSFVYLHNHPAEKETVLSGFKIIWQKIQVIVQKIIWDNWELLEKKYNIEKSILFKINDLNEHKLETSKELIIPKLKHW